MHQPDGVTDGFSVLYSGVVVGVKFNDESIASDHLLAEAFQTVLSELGGFSVAAERIIVTAAPPCFSYPSVQPSVLVDVTLEHTQYSVGSVAAFLSQSSVESWFATSSRGAYTVLGTSAYLHGFPPGVNLYYVSIILEATAPSDSIDIEMLKASITCVVNRFVAEPSRAPIILPRMMNVTTTLMSTYTFEVDILVPGSLTAARDAVGTLSTPDVYMFLRNLLIASTVNLTDFTASVRSEGPRESPLDPSPTLRVEADITMPSLRAAALTAYKINSYSATALSAVLGVEITTKEAFAGPFLPTGEETKGSPTAPLGVTSGVAIGLGCLLLLGLGVGAWYKCFKKAAPPMNLQSVPVAVDSHSLDSVADVPTECTLDAFPSMAEDGGDNSIDLPEGNWI